MINFETIKKKKYDFIYLIKKKSFIILLFG